MPIFDKLFNALKPKSNLDSSIENDINSQNSPMTVQPENERTHIKQNEAKRFNNQLEFEDALCQSIVEALEPDRFSQVKFKNLTLHTAQFQYAMELTTAQASPKFRKRLLLDLINGGINISENAEINIDSTSSGSGIERKAMGNLAVSLSLKPKETSTHTQAIITIVEGTGILEEENYILDSSHPKPYNIGRGKTSILDNGMFRHNDIAIKQFDGNDNKYAEINAFVSRSHACITGHDGNFFLKVNAHGLKQYGSSTRIHRGEQVIDILSDLTQEKLENDDIIVLNKKVMLQFNIL